MRNLGELLQRTVSEVPQKPALTFKDTTLTWEEVYRRADALRRKLVSQGVARGDIVAIYADHNLLQAISIFGITLADAAFQIINPVLRADQIEHQLCDSNARALIVTEEYLERVKSLVADRQMAIQILTSEGLDPKEPLATGPIEFVRTQNVPTDVSNIIYTSGSTGRAKGVVLPHRTILDGARIVSGYLRITREDVLISLLPFNFDYGLNQLLTCVHTGARLVLHTFVFPRDLLTVLEKEKVTGMAGVPSLWPHLFNPRLVEQDRGHALKSLRYITTAGGMHSEKLLKQLNAFFPGSEIIIMYGLTESFRSTYLPFSEVFKRIGSIGKAVPEVEILVLDENGEKCRPGQKGELFHRGAFVSYGYLNDPVLTEQKFIRLGTGGPGCLPEIAVRSGDIVSLDEEGYIYFHGRSDAQIKSSGYRISPAEVEEGALLFPGISHAAAMGLPDDTAGQIVALAYSTYEQKAVDQAAFLAHLREHLPLYAVPKRIKFFEHVPLTATRKVDYPAIRKALLASADQ